MSPRKSHPFDSHVGGPGGAATRLRIVGGRFRGRTIAYTGDPVTRPMKDNIREAIFNLIGGWIPGKAVLDLFAGTGAVGIEALSRGAAQAIFIERHFPTARLIRRNLDSLDSELSATVETSDTFFWVRQFLKPEFPRPQEPWAIFCCPPYRLYRDQLDDVLAMISSLLAAAPPESVMVVESDESFDAARLPDATRWRLRQYRPAHIAVWR